MEYELLDTGVFDDGRYFDVEVEYAKAGPTDLALPHHRRTTGARTTRPIHVLPRCGSATPGRGRRHEPKPVAAPGRRPISPIVQAEHHDARRRTTCTPSAGAELLFCENEIERRAAVGQPTSSTPYPKDGIERPRRARRADTVNPAGEGTKVAAHVRLVVPAGGERDAARAPRPRRRPSADDPFADVDELLALRRAEADEFYDVDHPARASDDDAASVMRQALAGMLWSKQCYYFDLDVWLREHEAHPLRSPTRRGTRNEAWFHMVNHDVISMPDKWEYPWYAAWDLAFHMHRRWRWSTPTSPRASST